MFATSLMKVSRARVGGRSRGALRQTRHATWTPPRPHAQHELFTEYDLPRVRGDNTEVRFRVNLAALLECLSIYGAQSLPVTSLHLAYAEEDAKLHLLLEEGGVTTECTLATADYTGGEETDYDAAFRCVWGRGERGG
jgi:hypothetical protein